MSLKREGDLNQSSRTSYTKAKAAQQTKNFDYSITLVQQVLKDEPLFLDGRRFLRAVEIQKYNAQGSFTRQMAAMRSSGSGLKFSSGKKTPQETLIAAEEALTNDPYNVKANQMVGDAGTELGYPEFKCFAYETLAGGKPKDKATLNTLALAYMEAKQPNKAVATYERIIELDPRDGDALSGLKNAQAAHTEEDWTKAKGRTDEQSFRDALKSTEESNQLETDNKKILTEDETQKQIDLNFQKHQEDPANPAYPKTIARLSETRNDFATARDWYRYAYEAGGKIDNSLEKLIGDMSLKAIEQELQQLRAQLAQAPEETKAELQESITVREGELNQVRLDLAENRVKQFPNEGEYRYELGEALYKVAQYKRATEELQLSLKQPSVRYPALNLLGLSFMKRGMTDFAISRLSLAESELMAMDDMKKEVTYNLGLAYEAAKDSTKMLDQWKKIYEVDMSYRDVGARVEASYGNGDGAAA